MVSVYQDADFLAAYKQKQKIFHVFMGVTIFYLAFCIFWIIFHVGLPYKDPMDALPKTMVYVSTALYVIFAFPFVGIKFSRSRKYYKMLYYLSEGMKSEECNYFYCFREKSLQKENIDVVGCVFETWNKKKQEWMDREAYCDCEKELPPFESGDYVRYIVQSNFVIQYEILEKKALEFEEVDDEEEFEEVDEAVEELEAVALSEKDEGVQNAELAEVAEAEGTAE